MPPPSNPITAQKERRREPVRAARQLQGLVDDLLDLSQLEGGTLRLHEVAFSLPSLVGDTVRAFLPAAREKRLELLCEIDADTPDGVRGDPARLRQVLTLLLDNALKFTEEGRVTVTLRRAGRGERPGRLALSVSDTGAGIACEDRERIFEPLTQIDASTTRRAGGAGLGLALGARLVTMMGGHIHLESEPGQGSTFRVEIDVREDPVTEQNLKTLQGHEPPPRSAAAAEAGPVESLRVLVAEDNWVNAFMASRMLERLGHRVEVVGNGVQAVAAVEGGDFEVVLMDLQMPEMDGLEATRRIRASERGTSRRVQLIAVTALCAETERGRCLAAGMDGLLAKPFTLEALATILRSRPAQPAPSDNDGAETPGSADTCVFDLERLAKQLGDDQESVAEVLDSFVRDAPATLLRLRESVAAGDAKAVQRAAHRLKGSLLWITAETAATQAAALESQARSGDLKALEQALDALGRGLGRVLEEAARRTSSKPS